MVTIKTTLPLALLVLFAGLAFPQTPDQSTGNWETADQHFRLILYRHQGKRQILFYGRDEIGDEHNRYVVRAINIRESAGEILFDLPAHPVYSNSQGDSAIAGHQSEVPARDTIDSITPWRLNVTDHTLRLDCAASERRLCALRQALELKRIDNHLKG